MISGRQLRILAALAFSTLFSLGCSVNEQLQGYLGKDVTPKLTISSSPIVEGNSGNIILTLSRASDKEVVVGYSSNDDLASVGTDYTSISGTVTFAVGQTSVSIPVTTFSDAWYEGSEDFTVTFTSTSGLKLAGANHNVVIDDDKSPPSVEFNQPTKSVAEDVLGGQDSSVVQMSDLCQYDVIVTYNAPVATGTADGLGVDYNVVSGTLTISGGQLSATIPMTINNDAYYELTENFFIELTAVNQYAVFGATTQQEVSITEEDPQPTIQFQNAAINQPEAMTSANLLISISAITQDPVTVQYSATGGTAVGAGADYTLASATLTIPGGQLSATIPLTVVDDLVSEANETIVITLTAPTIVALGTTSSLIYTIENDDIPGIIWTGATGDGKWSTAGNWVGGSVPGVADTAIFNNMCTGLNCNVQLDVAVSVSGIVMSNTFTGVITQGVGNSITIGSVGFSQNAGTFVGGNSLIQTEKLLLYAGSFTATSGTLQVGNVLNQNVTQTVFLVNASATYAHNNGKLKLTGIQGGDCSSYPGAIYVADVNSSLTLKDLEFALVPAGCGSSLIYNLGAGDKFVVTGNMSHTGSVLGSGVVELHGNLDVGSPPKANGKGMEIQFIGATDQEYSYTGGTDGATGTQSLFIDKTSGVVRPATGTTALHAAELNINRGQFIAPAGKLVLGTRDWAAATTNDLQTFVVTTNGTFTHNNGTVEFAITNADGCGGGTSNFHINTVAGVTFNNVKIYDLGAGCSDQVNLMLDQGNPILVAGNFEYEDTQGWRTLRVFGEWHVHGNLLINQTSSQTDNGNAAFRLVGLVDQSITVLAGALPGGLLTFDKSSGAVNLASHLTLKSGQDVEHLKGVVNLNNYNFTGIDNYGLYAAAVVNQNCANFDRVTTVPNLGTIIGGAATPTFSIASAADLVEGNSGTQNMNFVVSLADPYCGGDAIVSYATANIIAAGGSDYTAIGTTPLTFAVGDISKTVSVAVNGDTTPEGNETFYVNLSAPSAGAIAVAQAVGKIMNDDVSGNVWTGLAGDGKWSTDGNWADSTKPVPGEWAYFVPGPGACVGAACNATIDQVVDVLGLGLFNEFSGTVTQGAFTITAGSGGFYLDSGSFNASSSLITVTGGSIVSRGGTHDFSTSNLLQNGNNTPSNQPGTIAYNNVTINRCCANGLSNSGTWTVMGDLQLLGGGNRISSGNFDVYGNYTSTVTGSWELDINVRLLGVNSTNLTGGPNIKLGDIEIAKTGVASVTLNNDIEFNGNIIVTSGVMVSPAHVRFSQAGNSTIRLNGATFDDVTFLRSSGNILTVDGPMDVLGDLTVTSNGGRLYTINSGSVNVYGNLLINGAGNLNQDGLIKMVGSDSVSVTGAQGLAVPNLEIAKSGGTTSLIGTIDVLSTFKYTSGVVNVGSSTIRFTGSAYSYLDASGIVLNNVEFHTQPGWRANVVGNNQVAGNVVINTNSCPLNGNELLIGGNLTLNSNALGTAQLTLNGTGTQVVTRTGGTWPAGTIKVNKSSGVVQSGSDLLFTGGGQDLVMTSGTWNMNGYDLTVADQLTMSAGTVIDKGCKTLTVNSVNVPAGAYGSGTIQGGAAAPTFNIANAADLIEGNSGTQNMNFVVSLASAVCGSAVTVDYATANGYATGGSDYTAIGATQLSFAAGELSKTVSVVVNGDSSPEGDETLYVNLTNPSSGAIAVAQAVGKIMNDDVSGNVWTGLAGDGKWSTNGNWFDSTKPTSGEIAYFVPGPGACTGVNCDVSIDQTVSVAGILMGGGFYGNITQGAFNLTVGTSRWLIYGGVFTGSANGATTFSLEQFGGTINLGTSTYTITRDFIYRGGTFNSNTSLVKFTSGDWRNITAAAPVNFYNLEFATTSAPIITTSGSINVLNELILGNSGSAAMNGSSINVSGDIILQNDGAGTANANQKIIMNGTVPQTITGIAGAAVVDLEFNSTSTIDIIGTLDIRKGFKYTSGTVNAGTSTVRFIGPDWGNFSSTTAMNFNNLEYLKAGSYDWFTGTFMVDGDLVFNANSARIVGSSVFRLKKSLTVVAFNEGETVEPDYTVIVEGSGTQTITGTLGAEIHSLQIASSGTVNLVGTLDITGNFTYVSGIFNAGTSHVRFTNVASQWLTTSALAPFYDLSIMTGSGTSGMNLSGTAVVTNNLVFNTTDTITGGTFRVAGDLTMINATAGTSAFELDGTGIQTITSTGGTWPSGKIKVNKSAGLVRSGSVLTFNSVGQDIEFIQAGTWDMAGFNLTVNDKLIGNINAAGTFYKGCAGLTYSGILGPINEIGGTYGVGLSIADAADVTENDVSDVNQEFVVTVSPQNCVATTFNYATVNGTAVAPGDFTAITTTGTTMPANTSSITLTVATKPDNTDEVNENYTVTLSGLMAGVAATDIVGQGVILDDDDAPTISVADLGNITEGNNAQFVVSLSSLSGQAVTFNWATGDGGDTATAGIDYIARSGSATIPAGQLSVILPAITTEIDPVDAGEIFSVVISSVTNVTGAGSDYVGSATLQESGTTQIYRSVGYNKTTSLASGGANTLAIAAYTATFGVAIPDNIGVGDAIQYDSDNNGSIDAIAFINSRSSNTVFTVTTASGAMPTATAADDQDWSIYRAYTNIANADDGVENIGIDAAVRDFDTWSGGVDLVTENKRWNFALYNDADFNVTAAVELGVGWTTNATFYQRFYTPRNVNEVGLSQAHDGSWLSSGVTVNGDVGSGYAFDVKSHSMRIENIKFDLKRNNAMFGLYSGGQNPRFSNNIFRYSGGSYGSGTGPVAISAWNGGMVFYLNNNIFFNWRYFSTSYNKYVAGATWGCCGGTIYAYNNTIANSDHGFRIDSTFYMKNNLVVNVPGIAFSNNIGAGSNYNITDAATATGAANDRVNQTVAFMDPENGDFRLVPGDTAAIAYGTDLSSDASLEFATDISGSARGGAWDVGASQAGNVSARARYRSVGPGNTAALAVGGSNALTISGSVATFASDLPLNIGVGDAISYDSNGDSAIDAIAFIHYRHSAKKYFVLTANGSAATSVSGDQDWSIRRAYTSLANADAGTENTGIDPALRNFDTFAGGKNIVNSKEQWNMALYADGAETVSTTVQDWTTNPTYFIRIFAPSRPSEVGVSQAHAGIWDNTKARISMTDDSAIRIYQNYTELSGIQIELLGSANNIYVLDGNPYGTKLLRNIIRNQSTGTGLVGINIQPKYGARFVNNIVYDFNTSSSIGIQINWDYATNSILNNTVYNNTKGIAFGANTQTGSQLKNNLALGNGVDFDTTLGNSSLSRNNASSDGSASGLNSSAGTSITGVVTGNTFMNTASRDLRLKPSATVIGAGEALYYDPLFPFGTDIALTARKHDGWDIGAYESPIPIYRSVGYNNTAPLADGVGNGLTFSNGVATFAVALPDDIGVGDAIVYDSYTSGTIDGNDTVAFITKRYSANQFVIKTKQGIKPADMGTATNVWSIYRAYTSLATIMGTENIGIPAALRDFDTFTSGAPRNAITNNEQWNYAFYNDGDDQSGTATINITTDTTHHVRLFTPHLSAEVGQSQRHDATWNGTANKIIYGAWENLHVVSPYTIIEGLKIQKANNNVFSGDTHAALRVLGNETKVIGNIAKCDCVDGAYGNVAFFYEASGAGGIKNYIINNIIMDFKFMDGGTQRGYAIVPGYYGYIYNNTLVNNGYGITTSYYTYAKNNIVVGSTVNFNYQGGDVSGSTNNVSDTTSNWGTNQLNSKTVVFVDAPNRDYRLSGSDVDAKDQGTSLSGDANFPFDFDIFGTSRPVGGVWDVGAHEAP